MMGLGGRYKVEEQPMANGVAWWGAGAGAAELEKREIVCLCGIFGCHTNEMGLWGTLTLLVSCE